MRKHTPLFLFMLFISSCAQVLTPNGGNKDVTPPVVLKYYPDSAATNFTGNKIVIHFDEYVQLSDINNQLIISPPMNNQPEVTIKKKDNVLKLKSFLFANKNDTMKYCKANPDITGKYNLQQFLY